MWDMVPPKILVAVEKVGAGAALEYAAHDAARRGCGVHLVHVTGPWLRPASVLDDVVIFENELRERGRTVLAAAAIRTERLLGELAPDDDRLSVSTELAHGSVVSTLDGLSPHACLAVLEHRGMGPSCETETASMSVTAGVAAQSRCPTAAVPSDWCASSSQTSTVGVGIDLAGPSRLLIEAALHEAVRRGARLQVVHAWLPTRHSAPYEAVAETVRGGVQELVSEAGPVGASVPVDVVVERGPAGRVLRDQTATCDVMVLGRHHRRHLVGASLGSTSREVLRWSAVPLLFVDPLRGDRRELGCSAPAFESRVTS